MKKRKVLIDLRYLHYLNNGFGQLSLNYGNYIKDNPDKISDLDITLFVPKEYIGVFGYHVKYLECRHIYSKIPFVLPRYDVWHSIAQQVKYSSISSRTVRIITIHDLNFLYEKNEIEIKRKLKRFQSILDIADVITVISNYTRNDVVRHMHVRDKPIILNYVGERSIVDDLEIRPKFINSHRKYFFTIGQMLKKKNFHVLLDMMKLMPEYDLYICGDNSFDYGKMIEKRIADENIQNVFVAGMISSEEKVWMYRHCEAFLFPSKVEGFGLPLIEAMLFGKPVFSSKYTSLAEIGDRYAFFWDNFDPKEMASLIESNLNNFYNNKEFINQQKQYASFFSVERHLNAYFDMYRQVELKTKRSFVRSLYNYYKFIRS